MKLTGELKDKVDQTANLEEAKDDIAQADKKLTDDEVSEVAGGFGDAPTCHIQMAPLKDPEYQGHQESRESEWKPIRGQCRPAKDW